jgi:hypothetical protein
MSSAPYDAPNSSTPPGPFARLFQSASVTTNLKAMTHDHTTSSAPQRRNQRRRQPHDQTELAFPDYADGSADAGLWALFHVAEEDEQFSLQAIGDACGRSQEWVRKVEARALKKLQRLLRRELQIIDESDLTRDNSL